LIRTLSHWEGQEIKPFLISLLSNTWNPPLYSNLTYPFRGEAADALIGKSNLADVPFIRDRILNEEPLTTACLFFVLYKIPEYGIKKLIELAGIRKKKDKLPWIDLIHSKLFVETKTIPATNKPLSPVLRYWFHTINEDSSLFAHIDPDKIDIDRFRELDKLIDSAYELKWLFLSITKQWFGPGYDEVKKIPEEVNKILLRVGLPGFFII
jgi:hypothetical protein